MKSVLRVLLCLSILLFTSQVLADCEVQDCEYPEYHTTAVHEAAITAQDLSYSEYTKATDFESGGEFNEELYGDELDAYDLLNKSHLTDGESELCGNKIGAAGTAASLAETFQTNGNVFKAAAQLHDLDGDSAFYASPPDYETAASDYTDAYLDWADAADKYESYEGLYSDATDYVCAASGIVYDADQSEDCIAGCEQPEAQCPGPPNCPSS